MTDRGDNVRRMRRPDHKPTSPGRRLRVNWPAELRCGRVRIPCQVIDISADGAKVKLLGALPRSRDKLWLVVETVGPIGAEQVWRARDMLGIRFLTEHSEIARLQMHRFDAAAWLHAHEDKPEGQDPA